MANNRARRTSNLWTHSLKTLTLIAWLSVWTRRTAAQGPEVVTAAVGQTAALNGPPVTAGVQFFSWYKGRTTEPGQQIIVYAVSSSEQTPGPQSTGRESVSSNGTLHIRELQTSDTSNYTVTATLTTGIVTTPAYRQLRVLGTDTSPGSSPGLSAGAIVGIVIGVLAVIIIVCVLVYIFVIKKPASGDPDARDSTEMAPKSKEASGSPKANGATAEIQYSSVNFVPKQVTPAKPIAPENTVYSEVRRS